MSCGGYNVFDPSVLEFRETLQLHVNVLWTCRVYLQLCRKFCFNFFQGFIPPLNKIKYTTEKVFHRNSFEEAQQNFVKLNGS